MDALVLGGGEIKGAYEIGVLKGLFQFMPDFNPKIIRGISVGTMNSLFLTNARANTSTWEQASEELIKFWLKNIKQPGDIVKNVNFFKLGYQILFKKFNGITVSSPLDRLIDEIIDIENIRKTGVDLKVGAVNLDNGTITYAGIDNPDFLNYAKASKAIPIAMNTYNINGYCYVDGGLIDSAPIGDAIKAGASRIVVIGTNPRRLSYKKINKGNILELTDRCVDVIVNNTLNNDIDTVNLINSVCPKNGSPKKSEPFKGKRKIPIFVVRPINQIDISIQTFKYQDILDMIDMGYEQALSMFK